MDERTCGAPHRVYLFGDSVGLARGAWHGAKGVSFDEIYTHLLMHRIRKLETEKRTEIEYIPNNKRSRMILEIEAAMWELVLFQPTIFIVQTGIGDCSPRVFSRRQHAFMELMRPKRLQKAVIDWVHEHRRPIIKMFPNKVYTKLERFEKAANNIAEALAKAGIHPAFISIAPPGSDLAYRSPGIDQNVIRYNEAYKRVCERWGGSYIDVHSRLVNPSPDEYILSDGHHLNPRGHEILADLLEEWLRKMIN